MSKFNFYQTCMSLLLGNVRRKRKRRRRKKKKSQNFSSAPASPPKPKPQPIPVPASEATEDQRDKVTRLLERLLADKLGTSELLSAAVEKQMVRAATAGQTDKVKELLRQNPKLVIIRTTVQARRMVTATCMKVGRHAHSKKVLHFHISLCDAPADHMESIDRLAWVGGGWEGCVE